MLQAAVNYDRQVLGTRTRTQAVRLVFRHPRQKLADLATMHPLLVVTFPGLISRASRAGGRGAAAEAGAAGSGGGPQGTCVACVGQSVQLKNPVVIAERKSCLHLLFVPRDISSLCLLHISSTQIP
jgi:hypothetical protein